MDEEVNIIKRGETCVQVRFRRSKVGLQLSIKAHPALEDLMSSWGNGQIAGVQTWGRHWIPPSEGGEPTQLQAYYLADRYAAATNVPLGDSKGSFRINAVGQPLISQDGAGYEIYNLSFLRLVGISSGAGVSFSVSDVYTLEAIRALAEGIKLSVRRFYINYLRPIDLTITVSTQEMNQ